MVHEENTIVNVKLKENMIFKSELGLKNLEVITIDETFERGGKAEGPDAAQLLGLALLSCLNASFIFCLQKRKLMLDDLEAIGEISFNKNERGYMRIKKIDVKMRPKAKDPEVLKRINQCIKEMKSGYMFFEETCIITPSLREGINIEVKVEL